MARGSFRDDNILEADHSAFLREDLDHTEQEAKLFRSHVDILNSGRSSGDGKRSLGFGGMPTKSH